uniref:Spike glycoprotein n=1 Tax=229E-related bat coronavirus TaxID=1739614 RepID=A0A1L2KGF1_CVH22|nr:S protein [229E-related bat coronavirus]
MFLLLFLTFVPFVFCQNGQVTCFGRDYKLLKLGLPPSTNALVTGYLPVNWTCGAFTGQFTNVHGVFVGYYNSGLRSYFGLGTYPFDSNSYQLYFSQMNNQQGLFYLKVCKYSAMQIPGTGPPGTYCLVSKVFRAVLSHQAGVIYGFTVSGDTVRLHWVDGVYTFYVPGASKWNSVGVKCPLGNSCFHSVITKQVTVNVTTDSSGLITQYQPCDDCNGYAENIFAVEDGGKIPSSFSFNNWFLLTNSSSLVDGVVRSKQPMLLNCLWAVPGLQSSTGFVYFNVTGSDINCNGYKFNGTADVLRYNLNFTDDSVDNLKSGVIVIKTLYSEVTFYCTNNTAAARPYIPFGVSSDPYYCFLNSSVNGTMLNTFVGVLPPTVREFVLARTGQVYINGFKYFDLGSIEAVNFNITTASTTDFWTVAFASFADVLVNVSATDIQNVLYCDSDVNKLRCEHLQFDLQDGFYSANFLDAKEYKPTYVSLPVHYQHSNIYVNATPDFHSTSTSSCYLCAPQSVNLTISGLQESGGLYCVLTSHFTVNFNRIRTSATDDASWRIFLESGTCSISFDKLNNFQKFGTLCFSLREIPGGCNMPLIASWAGLNPFAMGALYLSWTEGDSITGVPKSVTGLADISTVVLNECTKYNIYGYVGTGILREANQSFISGITYVSNAGNLLGFKNVTTGLIYSVTPCNQPDQVVVYQQSIIGAMMAENKTRYGLTNTVQLPNFYYASNGNGSCSSPVMTYSNFGVCADGSLIPVRPSNTTSNGISAIVTANLSIPCNWTTSVQVEYLQISSTPVVVDCSTYVCNGNPRCNELLKQYTSACKTIEDALRVSARLESADVGNMLTYDQNAFRLANISSFGDYNLSSVIPRVPTSGGRIASRSAIEDLLFNKVVTSGLGTVDADYKKCTNGLSIADLACAQYYNGIMVLPGVADAERMAMYTGSLIGGMALGGITGAAAIPFSLALQARLNYVALQTDVLQENQKILASSFNKAMTNIVEAFAGVNDAISQTSQAIQTVATALNKIQDVVNQQGNALNHLTSQLRQNFQAISSSIQAIYDRLDTIQADQQVDRLITGRLAALNAFVAQTLTKYTEVRASRQLAQQKVNECVKSQSNRYGFCGNGTHIFSIVNAAPEGLVFLHTVLLPTQYKDVEAWSGLCVDGTNGYVLRQPNLALYRDGDAYRITSRIMFEPRIPTMADFVQIENCNVTFVNISRSALQTIVPEYIDVNKTLQELIDKLPNYTVPDLGIDQYNQTILNLTSEISTLENKSAELNYTVQKLQTLIDNINSTLVDLKWLNRVETYLKWPWWVWLCISVVLIFVVSMLLLCCCSTGCCGFFSCLASSTRGCCESTKLPYYDVEKIHIQ